MKPDVRRSVVLKFWLLNLFLSLGFGGAVFVVFYAVFPLKMRMMEVVYRTEGVPFAAGPEGVPAEQWRRMSATQLEIIEPMADMLFYVAAAAGVLLVFTQLFLLRLRPLVTGERADETSDDAPVFPFAP